MPKGYLPAGRERAVRMVLDHVADYGSVTAACNPVGAQLAISREALRHWTGYPAPGTPHSCGRPPAGCSATHSGSRAPTAAT